MDFDSLENQAVGAAINKNWPVAIEVNQKILESQPEKIAALNRLGRAYSEINQIAKAKKSYRSVLKINPNNTIAQKNLERLDNQKGTKTETENSQPINLENFLEEPGKTKTIKLIKVASPSILNQLRSADFVLLKPKKRIINVTDQKNIYLGIIPEDLSYRLIKLIKGGNRYQALVKGSNRREIEIFVREVFRSKKFENLPSFPPVGSKTYISSLSPEIIYQEKPDVTPTGEEEAN